MESRQIDGVCVVAIPLERIDASNSLELKQQLAPLLTAHRAVVLDLTVVQFIDSSGLGVVLSCLRELNGKGGDLKLAGMTRPVRALFELVRMHRVFEIHATAEAAALAFQR